MTAGQLRGSPTTSIGVVFPAHALAVELPSFAARAEALGYDELWVGEDRFLVGGLTLASTALAVTDRIRVGVRIQPASVRNAATVATEIATLAQLHPGRLSVAFGHRVESWMTQIDARPATRLAALGEVLSAVRWLLAGELVNVAGSFVKLESVSLKRPPDIPPEILAETTGPRGIGMARRRADGLLLPEGCDPRFVAYAKTLAESVNPNPPTPFTVVVNAWFGIGNDEATRRALGERMSECVTSGLDPVPVKEAGLNGASRLASLSREQADELAIVGSAAQCAAAVDRFADAGAQRLILAAINADFAEQYEQFALEVLPTFRADAVPAA